MWTLVAIGAFAFFRSQAPTPEYTPDSKALANAPADICGGYGHATRAVRIGQYSTMSLYKYWCTGLTQPLEGGW